MSVEFDLLGIAVKDMAVALEFYRVLGLEIPEGQEGETHVEVISNGTRIAWDTVAMLEGVYGQGFEAPVGHRIELAFKCHSREEVDAVYARITEHGYHGDKEPWDAFWGQRYAIVEDPDGNLISFFA